MTKEWKLCPSIDQIAKEIYDGLCREGLEETFTPDPFHELPEHIKEAYIRIAESVQHL